MKKWIALSLLALMLTLCLVPAAFAGTKCRNDIDLSAPKLDIEAPDIDIYGPKFDIDAPEVDINLPKGIDQPILPPCVRKQDPEQQQPTGYQGFYETPVVETTEVAETVVAPKTGDTAPVALLVSLALVSAAAFVACKH